MRAHIWKLAVGTVTLIVALIVVGYIWATARVANPIAPVSANQVVLGPCKVRLVEPMAVSPGSSAGAAANGVWVAVADSHVFAYASSGGTGELVVDSEWYDNVNPTDDLVFAKNLVFVNGVRRIPQSVPLPGRFEEYFGNPAGVTVGPVTFKPAVASGSFGFSSLAWLHASPTSPYVNGLQAAEVIDDHLYVHGLDFGAFTGSDRAEITPDSVTVNGKPRSPLLTKAPGQSMDNQVVLGSFTIHVEEPPKIPSTGRGRGGLRTPAVTTIDHAYGYVSSPSMSVFAVDSWAYDAVNDTDEIIFVNNQLFVNGVRRLPQPTLATNSNWDRGSPAVMGPITFNPAGQSGIAEGMTGDPFTGIVSIPTLTFGGYTGMQNVEVRNSRIYVYGLYFGPYVTGDSIEITPGTVSVNGTRRTPQPDPAPAAP